MQELTGGCMCGAVRYKVVGDPVVSRICWCRTCQKISGNGTANALFPTASITVSGTLSSFTSRADSGNEISRYFCPTCGCHVLAGSAANPHFHVLRIGTLDDPSAIAPQVNIWTSSAPSWACLDSSLKLEARQPTPPKAPSNG